MKQMYKLLLYGLLLLNAVNGYSQDWAMIRNSDCSTYKVWYEERPERGLYLTNDGGCIAPTMDYNPDIAASALVDRYDWQGNLIWDSLPIYNGLDSFNYYNYILSMLHLPNDTFVFMHSYCGFSVVDGQGNVARRVYYDHPEDSAYRRSSHNVGNLDMFYNPQLNVIECVGLISQADSLYFNKDVYDLGLNRISHQRIYVATNPVYRPIPELIPSKIFKVGDN